jgi:hypothetical protein
MKALLTKTLLLVMSSLMSACVTGSSSVNGVAGEVVERSRETAPSWAGLRPFMMHDRNLSFGYVHVESKHPDLPLGIKKTQLNALTQGKDAFRTSLRDLVVKAADSAGVSLEQAGSAITTHIDNASEQGWAPHAKVADIFFEKFRPSNPGAGGLTEFYNIYVMVEVPKMAMTESLRSISRRLKSSNRPDLQRVGSILDGRISLLVD